MSNLKRFDFSDELIKSFQKKQIIPVDFYNRDGQILIHKKGGATQTDINRVLRFLDQGIYYKAEEESKISLPKKEKKPQVLSETKLLAKEHAIAMSNTSAELIDAVKSSSVNTHALKKSRSVLNEVFTDFKNHPDAMNGIVNIIEICQDVDTSYVSKVMIKLAAVAMAIKTRGLLVTSQQEYKKMMKSVNDIMLSSFLCDISYLRMKMPKGENLSIQEYEYVQQHPIISYLIVAHAEELNSEVKQNILLHHHPIRTALPSNNYPSMKVIKKKLKILQEQYINKGVHRSIVVDIQKQLDLLDRNISYDEDANILAIASAFASLSSDVPWRKALPPIQAIRKIINKNIFNYTYRITREFLDQTAMSLCHNQKIIKEGDFLVNIVQNELGESIQYEVARVESISHLQSKPGLRRIGVLKPKIERAPQLQISQLNLESFQQDRRHAYYDLGLDNTRRIAYLIDPIEDEEAHEKFSNLKAHFSISNSKKRTKRRLGVETFIEVTVYPLFRVSGALRRFLMSREILSMEACISGGMQMGKFSKGISSISPLSTSILWW